MDPDPHESDAGPKPYREQIASGTRSIGSKAYRLIEQATVITRAKMAENFPSNEKDNSPYLALLSRLIHGWLVVLFHMIVYKNSSRGNVITF
jgi:hypothetical protein